MSLLIPSSLLFPNFSCLYMFPIYTELFGFVVLVVSHCFYLYSTSKWNCYVKTDSEAEEQAKVPYCYRSLLDIVQRRYSSASTYDVPKDSKAEEQPKVQDSRQVVVDEIQKGSCSPLTHYECRPADNFAHWLAIVEEFNERKVAGSGTKLTPEEEEAKLRYGPCECCGKEKDHATKNCPLKTIRF
ncbi:hypothetical protein PS2_011923 [Malus domestica]